MPADRAARIGLLTLVAMTYFASTATTALPLPPDDGGQTWDLSADWSDTANPNGPWSYNAGSAPIATHLSDWSAGLPAWVLAPAPSYGHIPLWASANCSFIEASGFDLSCGTVICHSNDPANGTDVDLANITWTSPVTGAATVDFATWAAGDGDGRSNAWRLYHGATLLAEGVVGDGDAYDSAHPATYGGTLNLTEGDVLRIEVERTYWVGSFEAFRLRICTGTADADGDGVADRDDNALTTYNPDQADADGDGVGDASECHCGAHEPPVAVDDFYGMVQGGTLSVAAPGVLANDSDPDDDPMTVELVAGPAHASSFQLQADGSFTYTPPAYFDGEDSFTYRVSDGESASEVATVHVTVSQPGSQGFVTGGGKLSEDGRKCTFGFVAKVEGSGVQGQLEFQDHDAALKVKSASMQFVYASGATDGYFGGTCTVNGLSGYSFFVEVHDLGRPGSDDDLSIWVLDGDDEVVYEAGGELAGGNIVIH